MIQKRRYHTVIFDIGGDFYLDQKDEWHITNTGSKIGSDFNVNFYGSATKFDQTIQIGDDYNYHDPNNKISTQKASFVTGDAAEKIKSDNAIANPLDKTFEALFPGVERNEGQRQPSVAFDSNVD